MKTIQKWFEQLAGISEDELERIALATRVFTDHAEIDTSCLKMPACWRRGSKVQPMQNNWRWPQRKWTDIDHRR